MFGMHVISGHKPQRHNNQYVEKRILSLVHDHKWSSGTEVSEKGPAKQFVKPIDFASRIMSQKAV
jgi:hypothetical protein